MYLLSCRQDLQVQEVEDYLSIQNMRLSRPTQYVTDLPKDCNQLRIPVEFREGVNGDVSL